MYQMYWHGTMNLYQGLYLVKYRIPKFYDLVEYR